MIAFLVTVVVIGVGYTILQRYQVEVKPVTEETVSEQEQIKSIAVLPFRDMSPEKDQDYFCEGLADDIILALTYVGTLNVLNRTSSFAFKGQDKGMREIGSPCMCRCQ